MNKPKSRNENIVIQEMNAELLIYDLKDNKAYLLNETSGFVLNQCDGKTDVKEIAQNLAKKRRQPVNEEIVWLAIEQLKENELLSEAALPKEFIKSNRREMIKRIGLATMLALPLVTAITAPQAAQAASNSCGGSAAPNTLVACNGIPQACSILGAPQCQSCSASASFDLNVCPPASPFACVCN